MSSQIVRQLEPLPLAQRLVCSALRSGPIPEHVAIIMDGNRRFAERKRVSRATGHALGYEKVRWAAAHAHVNVQARSSRRVALLRRSFCRHWNGAWSSEWALSACTLSA